MKKLFIAILIGLVSFFSCKNEIVETKAITNSKNNSSLSSKKMAVRPPGIVVNHSFASTGLYLGSPSICAFSNGTIYASCELHGAGSANANGETVTRFFKSTDGGAKWTKLKDINGQAMSNLFEHNSTLYIMGVTKAYGKVIIRKYNASTDTWTSPSTASPKTTGILKDDVGHHTAATPVVLHGGRLWRAMEDTGQPLPIWPNFIRPFMMSADQNADLLKASSWKASPPMAFNNTYLNGYFEGWLEGNAVPVGNQMYNVLRVFTWSKVDERAAMVKVNYTGTTEANKVMSNSFDATTGFNKNFYGSHKKFTVRYDSKNGRYLTLSNYIPANQYDGVHITSDIRNTLALCSSSDMITWRMDKILMEYPSDKDYHAFQYADWVISGNDLLYVVRTAFEDDATGANSYHNANYITFQRLVNYKDYLPK